MSPTPNTADGVVSTESGVLQTIEKIGQSIDWKISRVDFQTLVITATTYPERFSSRPVVVPIVTSSTFEENGAESVLIGEDGDENSGKVGNEKQYTYGLNANPTRDIFEEALAKLEGVKHAITFGSGTAAAAGLLDTLQAGDGIVAMRNIYGGTYQLLKNCSRYGIHVQFISSYTVENVINAIKDNTKMIWFESPANPNLRIVDIERLTKAVRQVNKDIVIVIDNTFLTPVLQRPIELGVDACIYSLTKYFGGHSDIIMGGVTTDSDDLHKKVRANQLERGGVPAPFDCYLAIRSLKTLPLRMAAHSNTCLKVAQYLETHPNVEKVIHPGLKSHENHKVACKQQYGHSGMMGFYIKGGYEEATAFLDATKIVRRAPSLGGDTSLGCIPSKMSHVQLPEEERHELGITDNYIRLSIGLESSAVVIEDIKQALKIACAQ